MAGVGLDDADIDCHQTTRYSILLSRIILIHLATTKHQFLQSIENLSEHTSVEYFVLNVIHLFEPGLHNLITTVNCAVSLFL